MAPNLLSADEAARLLGITPDQLNELRSRREISGVNAGGGEWKFKMQELERYAEEHGITLGAAGAAGDDDLLTLRDDELGGILEDDGGLNEASSILVSEEELGRSEQGTSSTIIGRESERASPEDSDIKLAEQLEAGSDLRVGSDLGLPTGPGSDLKLSDDNELTLAEETPKAAGAGKTGAGSDPKLAGGSDLRLSEGSDLKLAPEAKKSGGSDVLGGGAKAAAAGDTGKLQGGGSDLSLAADDLELSLADDDDSMVLDDKAPGVTLEDDDSDFVLGGSDSKLGGGSDVALAGNSGVNLTAPSDSGLSLEGDPSFDLQAVDDAQDSDDVISLQPDLADADMATQLKADDDFMLTPLESVTDEESDSGSQVIALDAEEFDADAATQLGTMEEAPLLVEETTLDQEMPLPLQPELGAPTLATAPRPEPVREHVAVREAPYSTMQVLSLFTVVGLLALAGMLMTDVVRNIWSFDQPYTATTSLIDTMVDVVIPK
jgi:excisionase family DNA binding protein